MLAGDYHLQLICAGSITSWTLSNYFICTASQTKDAIPSQMYRYTPNQHQQHKWAALVWRGWLTSSLIIGQMPIPTLRNETHPLQRANYQSQPLCSQQEMTSGIHVICSACQRKSALHQIQCKHQLKSRMVETVQSEIWPELPNNPSINGLAETIKYTPVTFVF